MMRRRSDGWPVTEECGPLTNHSNSYVGFTRNGKFIPLHAGDGKFLDERALVMVRDRSIAPISYNDAVLAVQIQSAEPWRPVTYAEAHERNSRQRRGVEYVAHEIMELVRLDEDNGLEDLDPWQQGEDYGFMVDCDGQVFEVKITLAGRTTQTWTPPA